MIGSTLTSDLQRRAISLDPRGREQRALLRRHVHRLRPLKVIQRQDAAYRTQRLGEGHGQDDVLPRRRVSGNFGKEP